ncbi:MAG: hypothetical protein R2784_06420 [Saprospiraceae bacterium]
MVDLAGKGNTGSFIGKSVWDELASIPRGQYVFGAETANAVYYQRFSKNNKNRKMN